MSRDLFNNAVNPENLFWAWDQFKKGKGKKSLTDMAKELTAAAFNGEPINLNHHKRFAALVAADAGEIDADALAMYKQICGPLVRKKLGK